MAQANHNTEEFVMEEDVESSPAVEVGDVKEGVNATHGMGSDDTTNEE